MYLYSNAAYPGCIVLPEGSSPDGFTPVLPAGLFLNPSSWGICHHTCVNIDTGVLAAFLVHLSLGPPSANWFNLPSPLMALTNCWAGLYTGTFHFWWLPTTQQDPLVNRPYCFSPSDKSVHNGTSCAWVTSLSDALRCMPSDQSRISFRIPGWLVYPIQALPTYSMQHPLNIQCSKGSHGAKRSCASTPTTSEVAQPSLYTANISFLVTVQWALDPQYPQLQTP